jgi:hypothetical protein
LDCELHRYEGVLNREQGAGRKRAKVQPQVANAQVGPVLDEATFQQILQAAYVIQEQNDRRREVRPKLDPADTLAVIVETQELLHSQLDDVQAAASVIAKQLGKITNAKGIAIALLENDRQLKYCAATGNCAALAGSSTPIGPGISEFLREEELRRVPSDVRAELLQGQDNSPVFPVYREGRIAGLLQLSFPESESIQEHEIRSCQVMAGLMGEILSRAAEMEWKKSLAAERATMLEALEQLRPQLERLAAEPAKEVAAAPAAAAPTPVVVSSAPELTPPSPIAAQPESEVRVKLFSTEPESAGIVSKIPLSSTCGNCGFQLSDDAMFCGRCGTPRPAEIPASIELPSDSRIEEAAQAEDQPGTMLEPAHPGVISATPAAVAAQPTVVQFAADAPVTEGSTALAIDRQPAEFEIAEEEPKSDLEIVEESAKPASPSPWSSAARTRKWLTSLQQAESKWLVKHSGDVSVAIAVLVLLLVLAGWNTHPAPRKVGRTNTPPQPSLTLFERMLLGLGLAEAPPAPVYTGNPSAQVWEDLHTGLYYCAGSELYGKTPGGKVTSQRDAQLDQFEPAARKICE